MNYFIMEKSAHIFKPEATCDGIYYFAKKFHDNATLNGDPLREFGDNLEAAKKFFHENYKYDEFYMNNWAMNIAHYSLVGFDEDNDDAEYEYIEESVLPHEVWIYGAPYILYSEDDMAYERKGEYTVKEEYIDKWFHDSCGTQVDMSDIEELAEEWGTPIEELMKQGEEN